MQNASNQSPRASKSLNISLTVSAWFKTPKSKSLLRFKTTLGVSPYKIKKKINVLPIYMAKSKHSHSKRKGSCQARQKPRIANMKSHSSMPDIWGPWWCDVKT
jgi:hypothetical protein